MQGRLPVVSFFALLMLAVIPSCSGTQQACPAPWSGAGSATFFDGPAENGACTLQSTDGLYAALSRADYEGSAHCGECLEVTGPDGTVMVRVVDLCPACRAGDLDLSRAAFARIASPRDGRVDVSWQRVACPVKGNLTYRFQGSNPYFLKLQVRNHRYGIAAMELLDPLSQTFKPMHRTADNHFKYLSAHGPLSEPTVRVTATNGAMLEQHFQWIRNDTTIAGKTQFPPCLPADAAQP